MKTKYSLKGVSDKVGIEIPIYEDGEWESLQHSTRELPRTFGELKALTSKLYRPRGKHPEDIGPRDTEGRPQRYSECGESEYHAFFEALGNPHLTPTEREAIEADMNDSLPDFKSRETEHFVLKWAEDDDDAGNIIADPETVTETGQHLEDAWKVFTEVFGRQPYVPESKSKIEVLFRDLDGMYGVASPVDGPIQLDAQNWNVRPGIRRATSAHELFHKLQYAFGFRRQWDPDVTVSWFSEGTASWAEAFMWLQLSRDNKLKDIFSQPDFNFFGRNYDAMPFWIFFESRCTEADEENPLLTYFRKCEELRNPRAALDATLELRFSDESELKDWFNFYSLFSVESISDAWRKGAARTYDSILDRNGDRIIPKVKVLNVSLTADDQFTINKEVSCYGSDYFLLEPDLAHDGSSIEVTFAQNPSAKIGASLVLARDNVIISQTSRGSISSSFTVNERIDFTVANQIYLVVNGRDLGGNYSIKGRIG